MNRFFEAFNELPKPPFAKKFPQLDSLLHLAPHLPSLMLDLLQPKDESQNSISLMQKAKSHTLRLAVIIAETIFNQQVYLQPALKKQKQAIEGSSLEIFIKELEEPITLIFSATRVDVLVSCEYEADCCLKTDFKTLLRLKDKQQLTTLIKEEALEVTGDIDVLQKLNQFIEKIEPGIGTVLSPIIGDLAAGVIESIIKQLFLLISTKFTLTKTWLSEAMTEGLQLMPHKNATRYAKDT
ncbi:ubiquinone biosynthesis accessory factor UbiJ [Thorsellia anophelis]|uniref:Ubiquinone biosynthesis protein UbiJ n=1 Tax=Thorsellia anophelis DSM 18579 TaxID=1123402 RepID=A0A1H9ZG78_9GAMM|nr:SCP2 sterol-binding domain-containing protein [Thorsellia anophelis]SES80547.1 ubiquinone biosynthesis protein UbiJ [Thorsellia anophelis DSM 18579]